MENTKQGSLTEGPILKVLTKLALPIMASAFLGTAYNLTDMAWIGMLGSKAVAGVGVGGMFIWFSQGLSTLARMGGQVHVGQSLGRGDREDAKEYVLAALQLCVIFAVLYGAFCLIFTDQLIGFFGLTDPETIGYAKIYLQITCGLIIFSYITAVLTGLYTAQGDSKTPLKANTAGLILNMILNPILIFGIGPFPKLGVVGAAIATVFAQVVASVSMIWMVMKSKTNTNLLKEVSFCRVAKMRHVKAIVRLGFPTAVQTMIYCGISMMLTRMVTGFGEAAVATFRVGGQIESLSWNTADGFAAAMNAFSAQNYGAGKIDRVKKGYRISAVTIAAWGTLIGLAFLLFPEPISRIFFHEAHVIPVSVQYLMIVGISEPFMCVELMAIGAISGLGNTKICSIISILLTGLRIPLAMILGSTFLGLAGIWWALTLTSVAKGIVFHFTFYRQCSKKEARLR